MATSAGHVHWRPSALGNSYPLIPPPPVVYVTVLVAGRSHRRYGGIGVVSAHRARPVGQPSAAVLLSDRSGWHVIARRHNAADGRSEPVGDDERTTTSIRAHSLVTHVCSTEADHVSSSVIASFVSAPHLALLLWQQRLVERRRLYPWKSHQQRSPVQTLSQQSSHHLISFWATRDNRCPQDAETECSRLANFNI